MGSRCSKFAEEIQAAVEKLPQIKKTNLGAPSWYRGKKMLKMQNGTPGHVSVKICEHEGERTLHVYTTNCLETMAAIRVIAQERDVPIRG